MDKLLYPRYDEPQRELKYVYDIELHKHIINNKQCCYYSPVSQHETCPNKNDCIFHREIWEYYDESLQETIILIKSIRKIMDEYKKILEDYRNGIIVYHNTLDDCYNITLQKDNTGKIHTNITVHSNFANMIRIRMNNLKLELRDLNRELYRQKKQK